MNHHPLTPHFLLIKHLSFLPSRPLSLQSSQGTPATNWRPTWGGARKNRLSHQVGRVIRRYRWLLPSLSVIVWIERLAVAATLVTVCRRQYHGETRETPCIFGRDK